MSIKKQEITGVKWTTVSTVTLAFAGSFRLSILARFLDKTDFGLMALVVFVMCFMNLFMDMGLIYNTLQNRQRFSNPYVHLHGKVVIG